MAAVVKLPSGSWRAQVRRKGRYVTGTSLRQKDAEQGAREVEQNIDRGVNPKPPDPKSVRTLAKIIDLHISDCLEVRMDLPRINSASPLSVCQKTLAGQQMSGKGNCYDNAAVETFFKTLKAELIWPHTWATRDQVTLALFRYINGF